MGVSVILPFYNSEKTLNRAARSILNQTYTDFELLLVDNNSTDRSACVAKKIAEQDSRTILLSESKQGVVFAHNKGFKTAKHDLIARMDADDYARPARLQKQVTAFKNNPDLGLLATQVVTPNAQGGFREYLNWQNTLLTHEQISLGRFIEAPIANPTIMYRRLVAEKFGSYQEGSFPEDYEMWLRWIERGVKTQKLPEVLLEWNDSSNRLTRQDARYSQAAFYRIKTKYLYNWLEKNNPHFPKIAVWGAGSKSRKWAAMLQDAGCQIEFYIDVDCRNRPDCIHYSEIDQPGLSFIVSYVSNWGARSKIKQYLQEKQFAEGKDFILAS